MPKRPRRQPGEHWLSQRPGRPYWYITWYDPTGGQERRRTTGQTDHGAAQAALADFLIRKVRPKDAEPERVFLNAILIDYLEQHAADRPSADQANIAGALIAEHFGGATVGDLTAERVDAFIAWLGARRVERARRDRTLSAAYVSRVLSVLRAALNRAHQRGEIRSVPHIRDVERDEPPERALDVDEVARLLAQARGHLRMFMLVSLNTLGRPDAVLDLTRFQIDLPHGLIRLNPPGRKQTKKYRPVVPITDTLRPWLETVKTSHVVSYAGGKVGSVKKGFAGLAERAGVAAVPYSLRHTMARELRRRGVPAWEVSGILGHKLPGARVTERYAAYDPTYLGQARQAIDAVMAEIDVELGRVSCPFRASRPEGGLGKLFRPSQLRDMA